MYRYLRLFFKKRPVNAIVNEALKLPVMASPEAMPLLNGGDPTHLFQYTDIEIFQLAEEGMLEKLDRVLRQTPRKLELVDDAGKTLLHHAAEHGRPSVIDLLVQKGTNIVAKDHEGNTALHLAAMRDQSEAVQFLMALRLRAIQMGTCEGTGMWPQNDQLETPMHTAVRHGSVAALMALFSVCGYEDMVNSSGWHGETPLHVACCYDRADCAKILLDHGADPLVASFSGMKPIHNAARRASKKVLEFFLQSCAIPKEILLNLVDDENQTPLHWAINNGDVETVELLMNNGTSLDAQMYDKSTPLHLACSQGSIHVVRRMSRIAPAKFKKIMDEKDTQGMTCLHRATMFDHSAVCSFLLDKGTAIDEKDNEGRTALILAASRAAWTVQALLLRRGAKANMQDKGGKNYLHYVIARGMSPDFCQDTAVSLENCSYLLDQKDNYGCTPLHYAAKSGLLRSSTGLLLLGAKVNAVNKESQSPLHFAAKYGRYITVKRLLETYCGVNIINESDNQGSTALHLAAENGHSKVVQLLMAKGALIHRDFAGRTPLHLAAKHDYQDVTQLIVAHYTHLKDRFDKEGNTALHLAAANNSSKAVDFLLSADAALSTNHLYQTALDIAIQRKHSETANAMIQHRRWNEILCQPSVLYQWPILGLIEHLPDTMMGALDRCVIRAPCDTMSKDFYIHFDFRLLESKALSSKDTKDDGEGVLNDMGGSHEPLLALNAMVRHGRCRLLQHPVCSSLLDKKWANYGIYCHGLQVSIYAIYLALLTYLICGGVRAEVVPTLKRQTINNVKTHFDPDFDPGYLSKNLNRSAGICLDEWQQYEKAARFYPVANLLVLLFAISNMMKEVWKFASQGNKYLKEYVSYLEWILYFCTAVFVTGYYDGGERFISWSTRWQFGACAIFIAWFTFMLYLQRFGLMGIYVVMFLGILKTLLRAMLVFSFLMVAFALAFHVLLPIMLYPDDSNFYRPPDLKIDLSSLRTPHLNMVPSFLRVSTMGLGDLDMVNNYIYPATDGKLPFPRMTYLFLWMFIIAISILLMNLMIGLAVGDIEKVQANATLRRIGMQVELHTSLERWLPGWILSRVDDIREDRFYPNRSPSSLRKIWFIVRDPGETLREQDPTDRTGFVDSQKGAEKCKQKIKIQELKAKLDQQHDLLRLIVQKMDINEEADELNEAAPHYKKYRGANNREPTVSIKHKAWLDHGLRAKTATISTFAGLLQHTRPSTK